MNTVSELAKKGVIIPSEWKTAQKKLRKYKKFKNSKDIPTLVEVNQAHGVHVVTVVSKPNNQTLEFDHEWSYHVMNERQWELSKKSGLIPGEMIVLHNSLNNPQEIKKMTSAQISKHLGSEVESKEEEKNESEEAEK